jgi:hypothetical protein
MPDWCNEHRAVLNGVGCLLLGILSFVAGRAEMQRTAPTLPTSGKAKVLVVDWVGQRLKLEYQDNDQPVEYKLCASSPNLVRKRMVVDIQMSWDSKQFCWNEKDVYEIPQRKDFEIPEDKDSE